jgi:transposase-like protein
MKPVCPRCLSTNTETYSKEKSWFWNLIDLLSGDSDPRYKCLNCGKKFD